MDGEFIGVFNGKVELALHFSTDEWQKMKDTLEQWDNVIQLSDSEIAEKLSVWAYKAIKGNIHSKDLQMKLKP